MEAWGFDYKSNIVWHKLRKDGVRIGIFATISPVIDNSGRIVGASKIARDITEQRRAEAASREKEARLHAPDRGAGVAHHGAGRSGVGGGHRLGDP